MNLAAKLFASRGIYVGANILVRGDFIGNDLEATVTDLSSHFEMGIETPDVKVKYKYGLDEWVTINEIVEVLK